MSTSEQNVPTAEQRIRELAAELRMHRQHPCLLFVSRTIQHSDVLAVRAALEEERGAHLDLIVSSPGGNVEAAYLVARELRRRFASLTVFVPFQAKSAATLLCLAGDELILGSLGELGPLDQQGDEKQKADGPLSTSRLLPFKALQQLQNGATELYEEVVSRVSQKSGMRLFEACSKAAELTQGLYGPLFGQLDPAHLAESARGLEIGVEYAERVLKRYRPALWAEQGPKLLNRLVHDYPTHGFTIDQEEAHELGIPTRIPDAQEATPLDQLALALIEYGTTSDLITLVGPPAAAIGAGQPAQERMRQENPASLRVRRRRQPKGAEAQTRDKLRAIPEKEGVA
jgi:hypothetical protein